MIKIFSLHKTIYLINSLSDFKPGEDSVLVNVQSAEELRLKYIKLIDKKKLNKIYFFSENINDLFNYFSAMFIIINAAGGLVKNKKNKWLFIFRNDKWDLPKGKVEKGESITDAAIREVKEECGISGLIIIQELKPTYHTYFLKEKAILKRTYWFEMYSDDKSTLVPQREEGITEVKWAGPNSVKQMRDNMYESIKEVIREIKH